jgi:hypothetical protein
MFIKVSHPSELNSVRYQFHVVPVGFIVNIDSTGWVLLGAGDGLGMYVEREDEGVWRQGESGRMEGESGGEWRGKVKEESGGGEQRRREKEKKRHKNKQYYPFFFFFLFIFLPFYLFCMIYNEMGGVLSKNKSHF